MMQLRFILADRFGWSWEQIKYLPAHMVKQYLKDIEKAKNNFKGLDKNDVMAYARAAKAAGLSVDD